MCLAPWADEKEIEEDVRKRSATVRGSFFSLKFQSFFFFGLSTNEEEKAKRSHFFFFSSPFFFQSTTATKQADAMGAKTLCIPFDQPDLPEGTKCFASGKPAKNWALWGRSY
jgi:hypothetical protein